MELDGGDGDSTVGKARPCGPLASGTHQFPQQCLLKSRGFKGKAFLSENVIENVTSSKSSFMQGHSHLSSGKRPGN